MWRKRQDIDTIRENGPTNASRLCAMRDGRARARPSSLNIQSGKHPEYQNALQKLEHRCSLSKLKPGSTIGIGGMSDWN